MISVAPVRTHTFNSQRSKMTECWIQVLGLEETSICSLPNTALVQRRAKNDMSIHVLFLRFVRMQFINFYGICLDQNKMTVIRKHFSFGGNGIVSCSLDSGFISGWLTSFR